MSSNDSSKNVFDIYGQGSNGQDSADEGTVDYKAFETGSQVNSIILNCHDGKTYQIFYSSFAGIGVISNSDQFISLILTGNVITLEGRNLRGLHKMIQKTNLAGINALAPHHIKPDGENDPVVEKITLSQLQLQEKDEDEEKKESA